MPSIATTLLLLSLLFAHISAQVSPIRILYRWELGPDYHGIAAFNNDNEMVGQACTPTLDTGNFEEHPISISVDHETPWIGTITVCGKTHALTSHPSGRDDPSCSWMYNERVVEVHCLVVRNGSMPTAISVLEKTSCFSEAYEAWDLTAGHELHDPPRTMSQGPQPHGQRKLGRARDSDLAAFIERSTHVQYRGNADDCQGVDGAVACVTRRRRRRRPKTSPGLRIVRVRR